MIFRQAQGSTRLAAPTPTAVAPGCSGTRHRQNTASVVQVVLEAICGKLAADLITRAAHAGAFRVAALDHKARDNTMEDRAVIKALLHQRNKVANRVRCNFRVQLCTDYAAVFHFNRNDRIAHWYQLHNFCHFAAYAQPSCTYMYFYCSKFRVERQVVFVEQRQLSIILR